MESSETSRKKNILFFDGVCHLCHGFIDFLVQIDRGNTLFYSPLQGRTAQEYLPLSQREKLETILYYKDNRVFERSDAVMEALSDASRFFFWIKLGYLIPRSIRNAIYTWVARHRYDWFGKSETCRLPTPEERKYLLE